MGPQLIVLIIDEVSLPLNCMLIIIIHVHRHVQYISIQGCGLSRLGLQYISDALCSVVHISTVTRLNLSNNFEVSHVCNC